MDSAANSESPMVLNQDSECEVATFVGDKRPLENGGTEELGARSAKKVNTGNGEMRRVAEILLVLSTMAGMRGGRNPTETELNLMMEARAKLVEICQDLSPKDLVVKDAIGALVEGLGLNWIADQRLAFQGPRLSIKDRFSAAKIKFEESKKNNVTPTYKSHISQPSFGANTEIRGSPHSTRMYQSDKPSIPPLTSGSLPNSAPGHVSVANSSTVTAQLVNTDVRASTGITNSHPVTGPGVDKTHFKVGGGSNGTNYAPQVHANQPLVNAPAWSLHSYSMSSVQTTPESKVNYNAGKSDGNQVFRPIIAQSTSTTLPSVHQPMQGVKYVQSSPVLNKHNEIAKTVQKILQPELHQHPTWTPPSREYMYKSLSCQMCHAMMNEVESVVVCDACEKGFHLKCLETINQKGIPRGGEWHCIRCTTLSNGKPLPPKYGRVMRSSTLVKGASNSPEAQPSLGKKSEAVDQKVSQNILPANRSSSVQDPMVLGTAISSDSKPAYGLKVPDVREMESNRTPAVKDMDQGSTAGSVLDNPIKSLDAVSDLNVPDARKMESNRTPAVEDMDQGSTAGSVPDNSIKSLDAVSNFPSVGLSSDSSIQPPQVFESHIKEDKPVSESNLQLPISPEIINEKLENSKTSDSLEDIGQPVLSNACDFSVKINHVDVKGEDSENKEPGDLATSSYARPSEFDVTCANAGGISETDDKATKHTRMFSDGSHNVKWIGDALNVADGKTFYDSYFINGVTYKVHDHALFCSGNEKFMPFKLQAMWEDIESGSKWVSATQCYFPGDLPEAVGHPCAPESNEVYESNHESNILASLIQGPCEVLPSIKFQENTERQNQLGTEGNKAFQSVFLCKWFYDESKGHFQPVIG